MSADTIPSTVANHTSTSVIPPAKLKNSCDICSLSKVRCEGQKPVCIRCAKLGHSCCYSVARRVGRRARHRDHNKRGQAGPSNTSSAEPRLQPRARQASIWGSHQQSSRSFIESTSRSGSNPSSTSVGLYSSNGAASFASSSHGRTNPGIGEGNDVPQGASVTAALSTIGDVAGLVDQSPCHQTTASSSATRADQSAGDPIVSPHGSEASIPAEEADDCMGMAMALQHRLNTANEGLRSMNVGESCHAEFARAAIVAMETVDVACDRLSTVLICPCSGPDRMDVGLMVATVCDSMLDVYSHIISNPGTSLPDTRGASFSSDASQQWKFQVHSRNRHQRKLSMMEPEWDVCTAQKSMLEHAVEELPRLASVVLQFATRYRSTSIFKKDTSSMHTELLQALASHVRARLQSIKNEAMEQLRCGSVSGLPFEGNFLGS